MKQIRDAIVIGAGIIGSATALALSRAGIKRVTLIDKGPLASGMTRRNAGLVHPFHFHPLLCDFANASHSFYNQWAVSLGGKSSYVETGAAVVSNFDVRDQFNMWLQCVTHVTELAPSALNSLFPPITESFRAAMFTPHAGYADAVLTAQAMVSAVKERGLEVQTGTQVKQILVQEKRIKGVITTTGELEAPVVVVAGGGWTDKILLPLGVSLHLRTRRGVVVFYEQPATLNGDLPMLLDANGAYFFRPHPYHMSAAGRISLEAQTQSVDSLQDFVTPAEINNVKQFVDACIPSYLNVNPKRNHAILYDAPADGLPALGRVTNVDGLYVAAGFGTSAFSVAPAVGATVAQLLVDGSSDRDLSPFDPLRPALRS